MQMRPQGAAAAPGLPPGRSGPGRWRCDRWVAAQPTPPRRPDPGAVPPVTPDCGIGPYAALAESPGATVVDQNGQQLTDQLPYGNDSTVTGGTATVSFRGVTFTVADGSAFYTTCYTPADVNRGVIPMVALPVESSGTSAVSVVDSPEAPAEAGVLTSRLVSIGHAGQSRSTTTSGPP